MQYETKTHKIQTNEDKPIYAQWNGSSETKRNPQNCNNCSSKYVLHGSATRFLRDGVKCYIYFADNLLLLPQQWKNFQNRLTFDEVIAKIRHHVFETQRIVCIYLSIRKYMAPQCSEKTDREREINSRETTHRKQK